MIVGAGEPPGTGSMVLRAVVLRLGLWGAVLCWAILAATLLMLVARLHWLIELATHFVPIYAAGALVASMLTGLTRRWRTFAGSIMLLAVHCALLLSYARPPWQRPEEHAHARVLCINVHTPNEDHDAVVQYVLESDADIVGILEVNKRWVQRLAPLEEHYPYSIASPRIDNFGIALYSRLPIDDLRVELLQPYDIDSITGTVQLGGEPVRLRVVHALPPVGRATANARDQHLAAIGAWASANAPCFVMGDFNVTMWSPRYRAMVGRGRLTNARRGRGILGTWPAQFYPVAIPIDHCLLSSGLRVTSCRLGPDVGSDHLPLLVGIVRARQ